MLPMKISKLNAHEFYRRLNADAQGDPIKPSKNKKESVSSKSKTQHAGKRHLDLDEFNLPSKKKSKSEKKKTDRSFIDAPDVKKTKVIQDQDDAAFESNEAKLTKRQRKRMRKRMKKADESVDPPSMMPPKQNVKKPPMKQVPEPDQSLAKKPKRVVKSFMGDLEFSSSVDKVPADLVQEELHDGSSSECSSEDVHPLNPVEAAEEIFKEIIHPIDANDFFKNYWEKKILHVERKDPDYYSEWFSTDEMDEILRESRVMFTEHLDVTSYEDGVRSTHNPDGRAFPAVVWDHFRKGCSVRMLCPQTFSDSLALRLNLLQEYFGCFVGANTYLTPPGMQGFAPHYDDIEAFIIQLEGSKHWRVYNPRNETEKLPRFSSGNFNQKEVGKPVMEITLHAGDMLYFPRGMIHQAVCPDEDYSFHLTVSTYQKNCWGDLLLKLLPKAVERAMASDVRFRAGLPRGYLSYMGSCSRPNEQQRESMTGRLQKLVQLLVQNYLPIDDACDEMGKQLTYDSLPPILDESEAKRHVSLQGESWSNTARGVVGASELTPDTELRLVRASCVRCLRGPDAEASTMEDGEETTAARLFHSVCNTRVYHEVEPSFTAITAEALPCMEKLIQAYPNFVRIEDFPIEKLDEKLGVASSIYDMGLVVTRDRLESFEDDPSDSDL